MGFFDRRRSRSSTRGNRLDDDDDDDSTHDMEMNNVFSSMNKSKPLLTFDMLGGNTSQPDSPTLASDGEGGTVPHMLQKKQRSVRTLDVYDVKGRRQSRMDAGNAAEAQAAQAFIQALQGETTVSKREIRMMVPEFDKMVRTRSWTSFILALITIFIQCIELLVLWNGKIEKPSIYTQMLKLLNIVVSILLVLSLIRYYRIQARIEERKFYIKGYSFSLLRASSMKWRLMGEILICCIQPWPYLDVLTSPKDQYKPFPLFDDKLGLFMFIRLYLVFRVLRDTSPIYRRRKELMEDPRYDGPRLTWKMSVKTRLYQNAFYVCFFFITLCFVVCSFSLYIAERADDDDTKWDDYLTSFWFMAYTMTSGEAVPETPKTHLGLLFGVVGAIVGITVTAIVTSVLTNKMSLSHHENFAVEWVQVENLGIRERDLGARLIQMAWRRYARRKRRGENPSKSVRRQEVREDITFQLLLRRMIKKLTKTRAKLSNAVKLNSDPVMMHILAVESDLDVLQNSVNKIRSMLDEVVEAQNNMRKENDRRHEEILDALYEIKVGMNGKSSGKARRSTVAEH